jgi:phosphatidylglycerol---prolipoprotein diacylglyceryl transferase
MPTARPARAAMTRDAAVTQDGGTAQDPAVTQDGGTAQDPAMTRDVGTARDLAPSQTVPPALARRSGSQAQRAAASAVSTPPMPKPAKAEQPMAKPAKAEQPMAKPAKAEQPMAKPVTASPLSGKPATPPETVPDDVPQWAAKALEQLLTPTCWLNPGEHGDPFTATIRFTGRRMDVTGPARPGDTFSQDETVSGIVPGSGPVAITAEVRGINPGTWTVTARLVARADAGQAQPGPHAGAVAAGKVPWPRRVRIPAPPDTAVRTTTLLQSRVPGVIRYAYACLVTLGVLSGLGLEALLLSTAHYPLLRPILFSVAAVAAGVIGGKTWYAAVHRGRKWDGWCIQGFVAGAAVVVAATAIAGPGLAAGAFLATATPALLIGMGIGRHGCFWAGCCTGRPTASRWGIWSSDRRLGCRRMPVQLLEAWTALAVGAGSLIAVLLAGLPRSGPVAVAGLAAYTLIRQLILGLRDEPRQWRYGRRVTAAAAAIALIAGVVLFAAA